MVSSRCRIDKEFLVAHDKRKTQILLNFNIWSYFQFDIESVAGSKKSSLLEFLSHLLRNAKYLSGMCARSILWRKFTFMGDHEALKYTYSLTSQGKQQCDSKILHNKSLEVFSHFFFPLAHEPDR